jgi:CBS domain-containing protein
MNVATILKAKGRTVATARADVSLQDIATRLAAKKIGAIVVTGHGGQVEGIISERDIIRALAAQGGACLERPVSSFMTRDVISCSANDTIDQVMSLMTTGRFRHVPVLDEDGTLAGLISIGDVVKNHIAEVEMEASAMKTYLVAG